MKRRQAWLAAGLILAVGLGAAWVYQRMDRQRELAHRLAEELAASQTIAARLVALRDQPDRVGAASLKLTELTQRIEHYAAAASIDPATQLLDINPQPPRRLGDSPYQQQDTRVEVQTATLPTLMGFLHGLTHDAPGLRLTDLRLKAPRDQPVGDLWDAEFTLSHLIYAPPPPPEAPPEDNP